MEDPAVARETITVAQCGRLLGIGRATAYLLAKRGELPGMRRLGVRRIVVSRRALDEWLDGDHHTDEKRLGVE